jgi:hypothetical protein
MLAGIVMGQLGYFIRNGNKSRSAVAAGVTVGAVAGPGIATLVTIARYGVKPATSLSILPAICMIVLAFLVLIVTNLFSEGRSTHWRLLSIVSVLSSAGAAAAWSVIEEIRVVL